MTDELPSKIIDMICHQAKGDSIKSNYTVSGAEALRITTRLSTSYVSKTVAILHKPFLIFTDLDGCEYVTAIEDIRKLKIITKPAAGQ